ncbi:hypothetical protein CMV_012819 [Castanea mollissima]|uniref:Uncharacterized protein n=1 Tax=Castanea mollissima TaxID=60419 RepID=A0A8J4VMJ5_9ROSI|nr:hypothetical protein CMV_012819 [Castanea mollissima]
MSTLLPLVLSKTNPGHSRFEFKVAACKFETVVVTVSVDSNSIISRQGTPFSPVEPLTFIYDSQRPTVNLITQPIKFSRPAVMLHTSSHTWTRERIIPVLIKFVKPVFGFDSSNILITGGQLQRQVISGYLCVLIKADQDIVSIKVPGNVIGDVAGNKNRPSNVLQVMHYPVPKISTAFSRSTIGSFVVIVIAAGLLKVSIASFHSIGEFSSPSPSLSQPKSNLFGIACHLQVIALSGWLAVRLPVEYYELTRGLRWSIPYLSLPWERETGRIRLPANTHMSKIHYSGIFRKEQPEHREPKGSSFAAFLAATYKSFAEAPLSNYTLDPKLNFNPAPRTFDHGWDDFGKNMFWLAIIVGSFISVHALLLLILKLKNKNSEMQRDYGVLTFPRFEMVIVNLSLPCICQASAAIIRGGTASGIAVGVLLLGVVSFLLLALLWFLYKGITCAQLLEYEEVHQEGQGFHCYQKIVRVFLVSVEKVNWTPKKTNVTILESLYEDYRGPPKSKLSQISGGSSHTQGAEAPFIQKLFGKLRIYYTLLESVIQKLCGELRIYYPLLESVRRVLLAIMAGLYEEDKSFSKFPTTFSLCINCFHLFFLVLEKPFIEKNIQLLEIMAVSSEACISAIMFVLGEKKLPDKDGKKFGILMLILVLVGNLPQILNELFALYEQIKQISKSKEFVFWLKGVFIKQPSTSTSYQDKSSNQD